MLSPNSSSPSPSSSTCPSPSSSDSSSKGGRSRPGLDVRGSPRLLRRRLRGGLLAAVEKGSDEEASCKETRSTLQYSLVKSWSLWCWNWNIRGKLCKYHFYWCLGSSCCQDISSFLFWFFLLCITVQRGYSNSSLQEWISTICNTWLSLIHCFIWFHCHSFVQLSSTHPSTAAGGALPLRWKNSGIVLVCSFVSGAAWHLHNSSSCEQCSSPAIKNIESRQNIQPKLANNKTFDTCSQHRKMESLWYYWRNHQQTKHLSHDLWHLCCAGVDRWAYWTANQQGNIHANIPLKRLLCTQINTIYNNDFNLAIVFNCSLTVILFLDVFRVLFCAPFPGGVWKARERTDLKVRLNSGRMRL